MAQLGIRDKNYRPNQYINPTMLISGGREANPEDTHYRIFDKNHPEHPDYEGNKKDDDGPEFEQLRLPIAHKRKDHDHTPDFQLPDGRDYYQAPNHEMMIPVDPSGNPIPELMNENMMISGGAFLKSVGGGNMITRDEYEAGLKQVRQIDNPLERRLAEDRLVNQYYLGIDPV